MELDRLTALAARQVSEVERLLNSSGVSDADVWKLENAAVFERFRCISMPFGLKSSLFFTWPTEMAAIFRRRLRLPGALVLCAFLASSLAFLGTPRRWFKPNQGSKRSGRCLGAC